MSFLEQNLVYLRKKLGLSQQALADAVGVNRGNIDSYERGSSPKPRVMLDIAKYFSIDLRVMLSVKITDDNYDIYSVQNMISDNDGYFSNGSFSSVILHDLLLKLRDESQSDARDAIMHEILMLVSSLVDENSRLKSDFNNFLREILKSSDSAES